MAQASHASFQFSRLYPNMTEKWMTESNFLVIVAVPNEEALAALAARAAEEGIVRTLVREPDLDNSLCAVALQPGPEAKRLCASFPLALKSSESQPKSKVEVGAMT